MAAAVRRTSSSATATVIEVSSPAGATSTSAAPACGAVNTLATEGRLLGAVQHQVGYTPMPPAGGMLPQCDIDKIAIWVQQGAPNN